jgi:hypothetical protein
VPNATIVRPITSGEMPNAAASRLDPRTRISAPITSVTNPPTKEQSDHPHFVIETHFSDAILVQTLHACATDNHTRRHSVTVNLHLFPTKKRWTPIGRSCEYDWLSETEIQEIRD